jgi:hypothetical protein
VKWLCKDSVLVKDLHEANSILVWFQSNYLSHKKYSRFSIVRHFSNGKEASQDPIFNVIFGGANVHNILANQDDYNDDLNSGCAVLRGHLASVKELEEIPKTSPETEALLRVRKALSRFNLFVDQLKRVRNDKCPFEVQDEYDIQNLLHAIFRIDFSDVRKEDVAPICAGSSSRIDLILKKEKILVEVKKTSVKNREKELGNQLIEDITRYKEYPEARILFCFIFDPEHWIENPDGLKNDLEKQSTENLTVEVIICPTNS